MIVLSVPQVCVYYSYLTFTTDNADLKILFNGDKTLRAVDINEPGYWDRLEKKYRSSKIKKQR